MSNIQTGLRKSYILFNRGSIFLLAVISLVTIMWLSSERPSRNDGVSRPLFDDVNQESPATETVVETGPVGEGLIILAQKRSLEDSEAMAFERDLLFEFAHQTGKKPVWKQYLNTEDLFTQLNEISGDLVISGIENSNLEFDSPIEYSLPWGVLNQQVVVRSGADRIRKIEDLHTRQVAVKKSSPVWPLLRSMSEINTGMDIMPIPEHFNINDILARVSTGHYDITVADNFTLEKVLPKYLDLEAAININDEKILTWAVRSKSGNLHAALNRFLFKNHLELNVKDIYREDLPDLQQRKILRLITYHGPVNYFVNNGTLQGFEYELVQRFARQKKMRVEVVLADTHEEMLALLLGGHGDVIAASLPYNSYADEQGIAHTKYYSYSSPYIVGRSLDYPLVDVRDLQGRRVILPAESPYGPVLQRIKDAGIDFDVLQSPEIQDTATTLFGISQGRYDLTVISSQQINTEFSGHVNLKNHFKLYEPEPHSWVVRDQDMQLLSALNEFIEKEFRKGFYNVLLAKYIENPPPVKEGELITSDARLSPYDEIVHKYAEQYGFDWRLITAQMYQESRFNPAAVSYAGAEGLMQMIPETAELLGIENLNDPDASIHGGIRYLAYLRDKFEDELLMEDRTWFSLAAYNAGYNRVKRARWLAEKMSLDKNKWFNNVEKAMQALARPYRVNGVLKRYCRCGQTTHYIREIKTLYDNYARLTRVTRVASASSDIREDI